MRRSTSASFGAVLSAVLVLAPACGFSGERDRANDKATQSSVRMAMAAAKTLFTESDDYSGISPESMARLEPSLSYTAEASTSPDEISVATGGPPYSEVGLAALSITGRCFLAHDDVPEGTTYEGTTYGVTDSGSCTGETALSASDAAWPSSTNDVPPPGTPSPSATSLAPAERPLAETAAYHQANLSKGETDGSVAPLMDVPGYGYKDVTAGEASMTARRLPRIFEGAALHSVVDARGTEVAFLILMKFKERAAPPDRAAGRVVHAFSAKDPTVETMAGRKVFLHEDPSSTSPYAYLFYDDGVVTWADDEDKAALRTWLESYLDVLKEQQAAK